MYDIGNGSRSGAVAISFPLFARACDHGVRWPCAPTWSSAQIASRRESGQTSALPLRDALPHRIPPRRSGRRHSLRAARRSRVARQRRCGGHQAHGERAGDDVTTHRAAAAARRPRVGAHKIEPSRRCEADIAVVLTRTRWTCIISMLPSLALHWLLSCAPPRARSRRDQESARTSLCAPARKIFSVMCATFSRPRDGA